MYNLYDGIIEALSLRANQNGSTQHKRLDTDKGNFRGDITEIPEMYCTISVPTDDEVRPRVR